MEHKFAEVSFVNEKNRKLPKENILISRSKNGKIIFHSFFSINLQSK